MNEKRTLKNVLKKISNFKINDLNLTYEIIFVDGGSEDNSLEIAKTFRNIKLYGLNNKKRGECIDFAIKKCKGDIIVIFPTDNEYDVADIEKVIKEIYLKNSEVVYGNRLIKCMDLSKQNKNVYKDNYIGYLISKYGGIMISIVTLLLYNRYLTDPLTTFKCFNRNVLKYMNIKSRGVEYDLEQFALLSKKKIYVNEMPVQYVARSYKQGKKITIFDGFKCIIVLFMCKFRRVQ